MSYPIMVAPSAAQVPLHPDGEIGMHRGATAAANTPTILSHVSSLPVDKVAGAATGSMWALVLSAAGSHTSAGRF